MANKKGSRQLTWADRIRIETLLKAGVKVCKIAEMLGVHRNTIFNEKKRGSYTHLNSDYTEEVRYSPDKAQQRVSENVKARGAHLKIGNDIEYANYIENKILTEDYSPAAVLGELKKQGREGEFKTRICVRTLYSYIDKGVFLHLTNKNLPERGCRKRKYEKVEKTQKRDCAGDSIERRPKEINNREDFGHWEMDSVIGKKKSKATLLVLTERKTRFELVFKLPDKTDESVVAALDRIESRWGFELFRKVFRTITVDNGTEFSDVEGMQRSSQKEGEKRTHVYYCHPYSSWERGSNENLNKMVRRRFPKGTSFKNKSASEIIAAQNWINGYPRKIHDFCSAGKLFSEEMQRLL